jgi:hypothetical protein
VNPITRTLLTLALFSALTLTVGCGDREVTSLPPARGTIDGLVFDDDYGHDVYFQGFLNTHYTAVTRDSVFAYGGFAFDGARSLKFSVPPAGSALGLYTGGVLTSGGSRDMADFNALTFYARASQPVLLDLAGFGNDNTGHSLYNAERKNIGLNEDWTFVIVPIPNSSKLISERGLLTFSESTEDAHPEGYDIWLDEIRYTKLDNIEVFRPSMTQASQPYFVGSTVGISGTRTIFRIDGGYVPLDHSPGYFDYRTSDSSVAIVQANEVRVVGAGSASVTATLGNIDVLGTISVTGYEPPVVAATAPTVPAADVISLFSGAYNDVLVDTWRADWGGVTTQVGDFEVAGNNTKMYSALNWVGIDFRTRMVDASQMTHFHLDVYAPDGEEFSVEFVTFIDADHGAGNAKLTFDANTTPAFSAGGWISLDIPLEEFNFPATAVEPLASLGQLVLSSGNAKLVLVDNLYWHK